MKRYVTLLLTVTLVLAMSSCAQGSGTVSVTASLVKSDSLLSDSSYSARLQAVNEVTLIPKVSATIESVNFAVGDSVKKGDVIFTLDNTDTLNKVNQAKASYDIAAINYSNTKNGNAAATLLKLQQAVDSAQIGVDSANVAYDVAKNNFDKTNYLVTIGEVSTYDLEQTKDTMDNASCQLENAKLALKSAQETLNINNSTLIPSSITAAEKQVESAKAALDSVQSVLDDTQIISPITGVISILNATVGEMGTAQTSNVTIVDPSSMNLVISVTETDVSKLKTGMDVAVTLDSLLKDYKGTIKTISPAANTTTALFDITINIDNSAGDLKPGMTATAKFADSGETPTLYVPQKAVVNEDGRTYVYVVNGNTVKKTSVVIGESKNLYVEVTSGITAKDTIVVDGADKVIDGGKINILKSVS